MPRTAKPHRSFAHLSHEAQQEKVVTYLTQASAMLQRALEEATADDPDFARMTQLTRLVRADTLTADSIGRDYENGGDTA